MTNETGAGRGNDGAVTEIGSDTVAAVDLGSNSFHMVVARDSGDQFHVIDRLREPVRLAAGLDEHGRLGAAVQDAALQVLERFGQRLGGMPRDKVRAVGTNTLRRARNGTAFLRRAEAALGCHVDIISGQEEARLIHLGVAHSMPQAADRHLVIDVGGGSTELIVGESYEPVYMESLYMGCVSFTRRFFGDGQLSRRQFDRAVTAAHLELQPVKERFRRLGWQSAVGASGTVRAIGKVLAAQQWDDGNIRLSAMVRLRDALLDAGHVSRLKLAGLREERAAVLPGGLAVLIGVFEALKLECIGVSDWALREGLLYDLLGRIHRQDARERSTAALAERFRLDAAQGDRVAATAEVAWSRVAASWRLSDEYYRRLLRWAARLHEVGLTVAHDHYHKHGAYLVANADMPGFSRQDQTLVAALIRGHRRKFPAAEFKLLDGEHDAAAARLCVLLRLSVLLHRSRQLDGAPAFSLQAQEDQINLEFPGGWLDAHPLTRADLEQEAAFLKGAKLKLMFR